MTIDLDELSTEAVGGGPGFVRVRVRGRARSAVTGRLAPPAVVIADGDVWRRLPTVAGTPPIQIGPVASDFAVDVEVPLHLLVGEGAWWLEPGAPIGDDEGAPHERTPLVDRLAALAAELAALRDRIADPPPTGAVVVGLLARRSDGAAA